MPLHGSGRKQLLGEYCVGFASGGLAIICDNGTYMSYTLVVNWYDNYREEKAFMRTACGTRYPTEVYVDLPLIFRSSEGRIPQIRHVAHSPGLISTTFNFKLLLQYTGTSDSVMASFINWDLVRLNFLYACLPNAFVYGTANATILPGLMSSNHGDHTDVNDVHVAHAHAHDGAL